MKTEQQPISLYAGFLTLLLPGLGHIVQGRTTKGVFFMAALLSLFHVGQAMADWQAVFLPPVEPQPGRAFFEFRTLPAGKRLGMLHQSIYNRLHFLGQMWIGLPALPAWLQYFDAAIPLSDRFPALRDYERAPDSNPDGPFNTFERNSDKTPAIGLIYTVIAGVLNLLVIFDAVAGPLPRPRTEADAKEHVARQPKEAAA